MQQGDDIIVEYQGADHAGSICNGSVWAGLSFGYGPIRFWITARLGDTSRTSASTSRSASETPGFTK